MVVVSADFNKLPFIDFFIRAFSKNSDTKAGFPISEYKGSKATSFLPSIVVVGVKINVFLPFNFWLEKFNGYSDG